MNCHDFNSQWIELVYGELEPGDAARCREHAAACSACAAALAALDETQRVLDELPPQQTRVDLARLCLKLSAQSRRARARRLWGGASAAAIVLVAVGLVWAAVGVDVAPGRVVLAWRRPRASGCPMAFRPRVRVRPRADRNPLASRTSAWPTRTPHRAVRHRRTPWRPRASATSDRAAIYRRTQRILMLAIE